MSPWLVWLIAGIALLIAELLTMSFFLLWIACAAFIAALVTVFTDAAWVPWMVFSVSSVVLVIFTRPLARRLHSSVTAQSNVDRLVGQEAIVLETVDHRHNTGLVRIDSDEWRARSSSVIEQGQHVIVVAVEGATLIVEPF